MKVKELLNHPLVTIGKDQSVSSAMSLLQSHQVSHLIVTHENQLAGVISKTDIIHQLTKILRETTGETMSNIQLRTQKIDSFMSKDLVTVKPEDDLSYAVELLLQKQFHCVPVVNESHEPVGILTSFDLLKAHYELPLN